MKGGETKARTITMTSIHVKVSACRAVPKAGTQDDSSAEKASAFVTWRWPCRLCRRCLVPSGSTGAVRLSAAGAVLLIKPPCSN
jgi:hypothetical protein